MDVFSPSTVRNGCTHETAILLHTSYNPMYAWTEYTVLDVVNGVYQVLTRRNSDWRDLYDFVPGVPAMDAASRILDNQTCAVYAKQILTKIASGETL